MTVVCAEDGKRLLRQKDMPSMEARLGRSWKRGLGPAFHRLRF
jgi:hypothetical protein